jgi:DNA helicase-2/ATP-dependent DNA helicase PcrA
MDALDTNSTLEFDDPMAGAMEDPAYLASLDADAASEASFQAAAGSAPSAGNDYSSDEAYAAREEERKKEREALYARLNPRQAEAVNLPDVSVLVLAGAGSGKTSVLTSRVAKLVTSGTPARQILAVTFTNKASEEMKTRLRKLMDKKTVNELWVGTFHSLCNKILRDNFEAAGLPKSFAILDTDGQEAICRGALKDLGLTKASVKEAAKQRQKADLLTAADPLAAAGGLPADDVEDDGEANEFVTPAQCAKYISSRKELGERPAPPPSVSTRSTDVEQMEMVYSMYEERCAKSGLLDFQDLLTKTVDLLEKDSVVRNIYRDRFSAILVDEFQDTNDIQYRWLELIKGARAHVMAVGDDYQSIYAFRGANPKNMFRFLAEMATDAGAPEGRMVKLEQNYRSLPHILDAANAIIENNTGQMAKTLFTSQHDRGERIDLVTFANGMFEAGSIARSIHRFVKEEKVQPAEIAVLYRTNQQSRLIEQELNKLGVPLTVYGGFRFFERQEVKNVLAYMDLVTDMTRDLSFARVANFPPRGLGERTIEELRQMAKIRGVSMMEMVGERSESMMNNPSVLGNVAAQKKQRQLEAFTAIILDLAEEALDKPLHKLIESVIERSGMKEHYLSEATGSKTSQAEAEERIANISELVSAARQFELDNPHLLTAAEQLPEYMAYVALMTSTSESDMSRKNTVSLMTVHSSKGLEFDHVFIAGLDEAVFPHSRAIKEDEERGNGKSVDEAMRDMGITADDDGNEFAGSDEATLEDGEGMQEERRLMYVAVTRARKTLTLTHAKERLVNGELKGYEPSRFLLEIPQNRLNLIDDANARFGGPSQKKTWNSNRGNHEYGGDAFDAGRVERTTARAAAPSPAPAAAPAARRAELRQQTSFAESQMSTDSAIAGAGGVRVVSKRKGGVTESAGETVVDVDRSNPVLGNRHYLNNHLDADERARVIAAYDVDFQKDLAARGPMFAAVRDLAVRVAAGERLALRCWCAPFECHGDLVAAKVVEFARDPALLATQKTEAAAPTVSGRRLAIIGTAGRDKDKPMTAALWDSMILDAGKRVRPTDTLVSGGAAWADHVAVKLFLSGAAKSLVLHLPAKIVDGKFMGAERNSAGSAANYYHGLFKRITGVDGLREIETAIARGAQVTFEPDAPGYGAMYARNKKVAEGSDAVLAYTFGDGDVPTDGGTKNTWDVAKSTDKVHVSLGTIGSLANPVAPVARPDAGAVSGASGPAGSAPAAPKPWDKPWLRGGQAAARPVVTPAAVSGSGPSDATRARLGGLGRRPSAPRPR